MLAVQSAGEMKRKLELIGARGPSNDLSIRTQLEERTAEVANLRQQLVERNEMLARYKRDAEATQFAHTEEKQKLDADHKKKIRQLEAKVLQLELRNESLEAVTRLADDDRTKKSTTLKSNNKSAPKKNIESNKETKVKKPESIQSDEANNRPIVRVPTATRLVSKTKTKKKPTLKNGTTLAANISKKNPKSAKTAATQAKPSSKKSKDSDLQTALINALSAAERPNQIDDLKKILNRINDTIAASSRGVAPTKAGGS